MPNILDEIEGGDDTYGPDTTRRNFDEWGSAGTGHAHRTAAPVLYLLRKDILIRDILFPLSCRDAMFSIWWW